LGGKCGCRIVPAKGAPVRDPGWWQISACSLHKAAPELLEACKLALGNGLPGCFGYYSFDHSTMKLLRAAIAKAEGKTVPDA
jgi:hypothetical protein